MLSIFLMLALLLLLVYSELAIQRLLFSSPVEKVEMTTGKLSQDENSSLACGEKQSVDECSLTRDAHQCGVLACTL